MIFQKAENSYSSNKKVRSKISKGFVYSLLGSGCLATNFISAKYALLGFNIGTFSFMWSISAAATIATVFLVKQKSPLSSISFQLIPKIAILGLLSASGTTLTWAGLNYLDPSFAAFLRRFVPVIAIFLGIIILKKRFYIKEIIPTLCMVIGSLIGAFTGGQFTAIGVAFTLLSCLVIALQFLVGRLYLKIMPPLTLLFFQFTVGSIFIGIWLIVTGAADFDVEFSYYIVTIFGAIMAPMLGQFLILTSFKYWDFTKSMSVYTMQPLFVLPMAYVFLNKFPSYQELSGGFIILLGAYWLNQMQSKCANKSS
jgi:drug/metabolite transporter (DMT)-like permease